ncbi:MAG: hypothetical protein VXW65_03375 [Pseudomonadota bacterium]|nr:hypothetical protein [Pseudomonadota bacterium]
MTLFRYTFATLLAMTCISSVSAAPSGNKDAKPIDIQSVMIQRCASEMAAAKITDATSAQKVCKCTIDTQASNLKLGEFWQIQSAAMNGQNPEGIAALKRIEPQLERCRAGVKFNSPS